MTERARAEACRQVGEQNRSVACVTREFGVGWQTIMTASTTTGGHWWTIPGGWRASVP